MKDIFLSFVIPVYNVENYLQECIDSITCQWNEHCEIILVDDGSTDKSSLICDQNVSERIRVIHKINGGLSSARNVGLENATGEYISFVDSDDKIATGSIAAIFEWIKNGASDYCFMQGIKFFPNGIKVDIGDGINTIKGKNKEKIIKYIASRPKFPGSACTKIYKRSFLETNQLFFPNDSRLSEDLGFTRDCILNAETYSAISVPFYEYRQNRPNSITSTVSQKSVEGIFLFISESVEKLTKNNLPNDKICKYAMGFVAYEYGVLLLLYNRCDKISTKQVVRSFLEKYKWVLKYSFGVRMNIVAMMVYFLGITKSSNILKRLKK